MNLPKKVEIVEVSPRDGLQMLPNFVPTADKIKLINLVKDAGFKRIEAVSFVSSKHVPQMADANEILQVIGDDPNIDEVALALNQKGYQRAIDAKVDWICYVMAATETFSQKNANTTIADGLAMTKNCIADAHASGVKVRASISVTWICPYEGEVPKERVLEITKELVEAGADEIAFNDTVGKATPNDVFELCNQAKQLFPTQQFAAHFHDTYFTALANIYAALTAGWNIFDSSAGGLGGCPFSPGASGNIATEKVVWMLNKMNIETGIDFDKLKICADFAKNIETQAKKAVSA
ncbi:MAG TPA: hydroxymethylglutaryl-CoA lyase [Pyrinomonadaceae bacterium]|nr:hydroxymethylglutaryl-CoA lyase [Pyrinomonadaceae bacterium]